MYVQYDSSTPLWALGACAATFFLSVVAWLTHIVNTINAEQWLLLIAGAVCFPVGVIHGVGIWLGWF